ncbi:MAG: hypothetical protein WCA33_16445, partial [Candidatus Acidiferrales bacterium]
TEVKQHSHRDAIRVPRERCVRGEKKYEQNLLKRSASLEITPKPDISNNVGPVKLFLNALLSFHLKELFSFAFFGFLSSCIDDHGSFVI